jgi:DNA-binding MarR family transcriptional regulator
MCPCPHKTETVRNMKPEALARRLLKTFRLLHNADLKAMDDSLTMMNESGLTVPQLIALHVLRSEGARSVGEIADRTRLSQPATSHLVDRLVAMGFVVRVEDENDRRQKQISLGPKGVCLVDKLFESRLNRLAVGMNTLSPETRARLYDMLTDMARELSERTPACRGSKEAEQ